MDIKAIINEEIKKFAYSIPDLADTLVSQGYDKDVLIKLFQNYYQKQGDAGVIRAYEDLTGVQIEALRNGRYVFANLVDPQGLYEMGFATFDMLKEVGEGTSQPYDWYEANPIEGNLEYFFRTEDEDIYEVQMQDLGNYWNVDFKTKTGNFEDVLNKGRFWRVMATLGEIVRDFLIKTNPELIRVSPAKNKRSDFRRQNIYRQYFEKQLPSNYEVSVSGDYLYITRFD